MKIHDLKPAPGSHQAPQARRPRHRRQGRQDRRPRHQGPEGPRHRPASASRAARLPLHQRVPKLKGFNNPFRVEYQVVNLDVLDGHAASTTSTPRRCTARASSHKGAPRQGARPGRDHPGAVTVKAHALLASRPRQPSWPPAVRSRSCPLPWGDRSSARQGQRTSPTAEPSTRRPGAPGAQLECCHRPAEHVPGPRPPEQDPVHLARSSCSTGWAPTSRSRASTSTRSRQLQEQAETRRRPRLPPPVLRRRAHALRRLRPRDHAVHHGVDHHADPRRGDPQARAVAEAGRGRPAQDHPVDPLPHHRHRARCSPPASRSCSTTAAAALGSATPRAST